MTQPRIYLSPPHVSNRERNLLLEAFDSNWIAPLGPMVDAFEREICDYTGAKYALALSSGTAAIHLALIHLGVGTGDEVFVSDLTFSASVNTDWCTKVQPLCLSTARQPHGIWTRRCWKRHCVSARQSAENQPPSSSSIFTAKVPTSPKLWRLCEAYDVAADRGFGRIARWLLW